MISRIGELCVTAVKYGRQRTRTDSLFLITHKQNQQIPKDTKPGGILRRACSLQILKLYKMLIAQKKKVMTGVKKTGVKIHIGADVPGLPYADIVTTADVTDGTGAVEMFSQPGFSLPTLKAVLCDGGCAGENFAAEISGLTGATVEAAKRSELHTFAVIPKRRIEERSFRWLNKCRRLRKNCGRKPENTLNMVKSAFIPLLLRRYRTGS